MLYRSAASSGTFLHIHNAVVDLIEPPQAEGAEVDGEDTVPDGLEADLSALEKGADEDFSVIPTHGVVSGDAADREVAGVFEGRRAAGKGPLGRMVKLRRELHVEGLVGPLVVIDPTKVIEPALLGGEGRPGSVMRKGGSLLERPVHAFMASILVGLSGLDALGEDAEGDPPDGELGEAGDRGGSEGVPVVATDPTWEAEGAEETLETAHCGLKIEAVHAPASEEETGMAVLNGERIAQLPIAGPELALEVRGSGAVGFGEDPNGRPGCVRRRLGFRLSMQPLRLSIRPIVSALGTFSMAGSRASLPRSVRAPHPYFLRSSRMRVTVTGGVECGQERGRWERSRSPSIPSSWKRRIHLKPVGRLIPCRLHNSACERSEISASITKRARSSSTVRVLHGIGHSRLGEPPVYMETCKPSALYVL